MIVTTADDLRANLIGAWTLQWYVSMSIDGSDVVYPLGVDARGIIMYSPDAYMSAQLMRGDDAEGPRVFQHPGPFTVVEDGLIAHHVEVSLRRDWIGGIQYRKAHLHVGHLELGPGEPILLDGELRRQTCLAAYLNRASR